MRSIYCAFANSKNAIIIFTSATLYANPVDKNVTVTPLNRALQTVKIIYSLTSFRFDVPM